MGDPCAGRGPFLQGQPLIFRSPRLLLRRWILFLAKGICSLLVPTALRPSTLYSGRQVNVFGRCDTQSALLKMKPQGDRLALDFAILVTFKLVFARGRLHVSHRM